jgi:EmrB/QacA subfamily drug resistance transporter
MTITLPDHAAAPYGPAHARPWLTLFVMCSAFVMAMVDAAGVAVALPRLQAALDLGQGQLQWVITIYTLTLASALATGGRLGDVFGRLRTFVIGVLLFVCGSLICGLANGLPMLLGGRLVEGLGNVLMVPVAAVLASEALGPQQRGRAMGLYSAVGGAAMILAPLIGGALVQFAGWRAIFFVNLPVAVIALLLLRVARPSVPALPPQPLRFAQAPLLILALGMLVLGLQESHTWLWTSPITLGLVFGGMALLGLFCAIQTRQDQPLLDVRLFRSRSFAMDAVVLFCCQFAVIGQSAFSAIYFQRVMAFSPLQTAFAIIGMPIAWVLLSPVAGRLYDRAGIRRPVVLGLALVTLGAALEVVTLPLRDLLWLIPALILIGAGLGLALPQTYTDGMAQVATQYRGQAYGLLDTCRQLGGALGMAAVGTVVASREAARIGALAAAFGHGAAGAQTLRALLRGAAEGQAASAHGLVAAAPGALAALRLSGAASIADGYCVTLTTVAVGLVLTLILMRGQAPRGEASLMPIHHKELAPK